MADWYAAGRPIATARFWAGTGSPSSTRTPMRGSTSTIWRSVMRESSERPSLRGCAEPGTGRSGQRHGERTPEGDAQRGQHRRARRRPARPRRRALPETPATCRRRRRPDADAGARTAASSGMAAPTANVAADASAAWTGRAACISVMPSSSRACAPSGVVRHQLVGDLAGEVRRRARVRGRWMPVPRARRPCRSRARSVRAPGPRARCRPAS